MFPIKDNNPTLHKPVMTVALIAINIAVHFYQVLQGQLNTVVVQFGLIPYELVSGVELTPELAFPSSLTIITSMFLHGGWMHLLGNMLYLWIFGNNIEDHLGPIRFLAFYLLAGISAVLLFVVTGPNTQIPLVGASGAVAGVLGAYALHFPKARVLVLIFLGWFIRMVWIPAIAVLGIWFVMQLLFALPAIGSATGGGVAYMAHVGGFLFGLAGAWMYRGRFKKQRVLQRKK